MYHLSPEDKITIATVVEYINIINLDGSVAWILIIMEFPNIPGCYYISLDNCTPGLYSHYNVSSRLPSYSVRYIIMWCDVTCCHDGQVLCYVPRSPSSDR